MMHVASENLHFGDRYKQVVFFFRPSRSKKIEDMFPVFLSSYKNTHESLETLACPHTFLVLQNLHSCCYTVHDFYFLITYNCNLIYFRG